MEDGGIIVRIVGKDEVPPPQEEVAALYLAAGWIGEEDDRSFIAGAVRDCAVFAGAFDRRGVLVGMARALSDGCSDAYIQDVAVLPGFRKHGIGGRLVCCVTAELRRRHVDWIGLVGEPGTAEFYERLGFEVMPGYIPMRCKVEE